MPTQQVQSATDSKRGSTTNPAMTSMNDSSTAAVAVTAATAAAVSTAAAGDGAAAVAARHGPRSPSPMSTPLVRFPATAAAPHRPLALAVTIAELTRSPAAAAECTTPGRATPELQQSTSPFAPPAPATGAAARLGDLRP